MRRGNFIKCNVEDEVCFTKGNRYMILEANQFTEFIVVLDDDGDLHNLAFQFVEEKFTVIEI